MTTIAFDGKTLACDSQGNGAYTVQGPMKKIWKVRNLIFGWSGLYSDSILYRDWLIAGRPEKKPDIGYSGEGCALLIEGGKAWLQHAPHFVKVPVGPQAAVGCGCDFAMGAMLAGADARQAVKIAVKLDKGSGGKVQALSINEPKHVTNSAKPKRSARLRARRRAK